MKRYSSWRICLLLLLLALSLQSCLGFGSGSSSSSNFKQVKAGHGQQLSVNTDQAVFKGKIYFTQNHDLLVLDGTRTVHALTSGMEVHDPSVSPDGKWVAFIARYKDYSNLMLIASDGSSQRRLRSGKGAYYYNSANFLHDTYYWYAQPTWSPNGKNLLFLSDLEKEDWYTQTGVDAPMLDLQVFSIPLSYPSAKPLDVAYASFGDGGDSDPSYRPGHPDQIIYTHYAYDSSHALQVIQLFMENPSLIATHPGKYYPGVANQGYDPGIGITPPSTSIANLQPTFSPDGNQIAYVRRLDANHMGIYVMPVPENITNDPNNPTVIKRALQPYQKSSLIVSGQFVSQPVWSPDGKQIAYLAYNNNTFDIWLASVKPNAKTGAYSMQGSPIQLTQGGIDGDSRPFWTP